MSPRTLLIVNPHGGRGAALRRWRRAEPRVRRALPGAEVELTRAPGDAERLAREAVRAGVERVVVAGGDGTLNEVVCGLLGAELGGYAELALLPLGTGCDFARSLGVPRDPEAAVALLDGAVARDVDAGCVRYRDGGGAPRERYFLNAASLGVSSLALKLANRVPQQLGASVAFALGTGAALLRHRSRRVVLRVDGECVADGPLVLAAVASGRYFGGGMQVAPEACLDDAQFDVVSVDGIAAPRLLWKLPKIYRGVHLKDPIVKHWRGRRIEAEAPDGEVLIEADGELLGRLPAEIEVLPAALRVLGPAPTSAPRGLGPAPTSAPRGLGRARPAAPR